MKALSEVEGARDTFLRDLHGDCEYCDGSEEWPNPEMPCPDGVQLLQAWQAGFDAALGSSSEIHVPRSALDADGAEES